MLCWPVTSSRYAYERSQTHSWHHGRQFLGKEYRFLVSQFSWDTDNPGLSLFGRVIYSLQPNGRFRPYKHRGWDGKKFQNVSILPSFRGGMLTMRIGDFFFSNMFKLGRNRPIAQLRFHQHQTCTFQVLCTICGHHCIFTPAVFGMPTKPAGRFGITSVQKPADVPSILPSTSCSCTFKHMDTTLFYILHPGFFSEEHINRWRPIFW